MTTALAPTLSARLDTLSDRINDEHRRCEAAIVSGLEHALQAGRLLIEAKALCPHGAWLPWLADHFEGSERTTQAYMRVAERYPELTGPNPQHVADLSLRGALAALAEPKAGAEVPRPDPDAWLRAERDALGVEDPDTAAFERAYPFRWRLTKVALLMPPNLSQAEWGLIGEALRRWMQVMGKESSALMWWMGDWFHHVEVSFERHDRARKLAQSRPSWAADHFSEDQWAALLFYAGHLVHDPKAMGAYAAALVDHQQRLEAQHGHMLDAIRREAKEVRQ
jgi:hypothetical protein